MARFISRNSGRVRLEVIRPQDLSFLYSLAIDAEAGLTGRFRGTVPTQALFESTLWQGVLVQFVAKLSRGEPIGLLTAYNADLNSGYCYLGVSVAPKFHKTGLAAEALLVFVRYVFATWNIRKIYCEIPAFNYGTIRSGEGTLFEVEGILKDHVYLAGRFHDQLIVSIRREFEDAIEHSELYSES